MKNKKQKTPKLPKYEYGNMHENMHAEQQSGTQNIYNQGRSSKINAGQIGQYAGYAAVAGQTAGNLADINNQDYNGDTKAYAQSQAIGNGLTQSGAAFSPLIGMGTGIRKSATAMVGDQSGANRTASNWMAAPHEAASSDLSAANNSNNTQSQKIGAYGAVLGDFNPAGTKLRQMFSYGTGNDEKTTGFWGKYNDLTGISARNNQKNSLEQNQFAFGGTNIQPNAEGTPINNGNTGVNNPNLSPEMINYILNNMKKDMKYKRTIEDIPMGYKKEVKPLYSQMGFKKTLTNIPVNMNSIPQNTIQQNYQEPELRFSNGGRMNSEDMIHAPELGGYFRKKSR